MKVLEDAGEILTLQLSRDELSVLSAGLLSTLDLLTHPHADGGEMVVRGDHSVAAEHAVIHLDLHPVAAGPPGRHHSPGRSGADGGAAGRGEVEAGVTVRPQPAALAEAGCQPVDP